jgi:PA14 domain-containing protein/List-Bact-rpt repeat protein/fibronectin type III domain protein
MPSVPPVPVNYSNLGDVRFGRFFWFIALFLISSHAQVRAAESVRLGWNASPSSGVTGYRVYYRPSSSTQSTSVNVGNVLTAIISNLNDTTTYLFWVTAYNSAGLESSPSNVLSYMTPSSSAEAYSLTVYNGTGDGSYPPGTEVTVTARPPQPGEEFEVWEGDIAILDDFTSATTQALIPLQDVSITATYSVSSGGTGTGLRGEYYNDSPNDAYPLNTPFAGSPALTRTDATVDFDWGSDSPASQVNSNFFSARWTGQVKAPVSGSYTFTVTGDDGVRLFINGTTAIDGWRDQGATPYSYTTTLSAGTLYNIELHYYEHESDAVCRLLWSYPGQSTQTIPSSQLYPSSGP